MLEKQGSAQCLIAVNIVAGEEPDPPFPVASSVNISIIDSRVLKRKLAIIRVTSTIKY